MNQMRSIKPSATSSCAFGAINQIKIMNLSAIDETARIVSANGKNARPKCFGNQGTHNMATRSKIGSVNNTITVFDTQGNIAHTDTVRVKTVLNLDNKKTAKVRLRAFVGGTGAQVADATLQLQSRDVLNLGNRRGALSALKNFEGTLWVTAERGGSQRLFVMQRTMLNNAEGKITNLSGYVCR